MEHDTEAAWAAGFFDGEGHVQLRHQTKRRPYRNPSWILLVTIVNTCLPALERLQHRWHGTIYHRPPIPNRRPIHYWTAGSRIAEVFLRDVQPFCTCKAENIALALEARTIHQPRVGISLTPEQVERLFVLQEALKAANHVSYPAHTSM